MKYASDSCLTQIQNVLISYIEVLIPDLHFTVDVSIIGLGESAWGLFKHLKMLILGNPGPLSPSS